MALSIGFWVLAAVAVIAALMVVTVKSVFRAALSLVLALVAIAGLYVTLNADFVAGVQILVYVGAISILLIIAIMLTREVQQGGNNNRFAVPAFLTALVFFGVMCFVFLGTNWRVTGAFPAGSDVSQPTGGVYAAATGKVTSVTTSEITVTRADGGSDSYRIVNMHSLVEEGGTVAAGMRIAEQVATTGPLAAKLFGEDGYLITVEISGVLLLAAILGAMALAREK